MLITINKDRTVTKSYSESEGSQNENRITELQFAIPEDFDDFLKKIVFITEDGTFWDYIEDDEYIIKNNISKYKEIQAFVWMTNVETQQDFRTMLFDLKFYYNENPNDFTPSEQQISGFDTMMEELQEAIREVESLPTMSKEIVEELPTEDIDPNVIYLVLREDSEPDNIYDEWLYINDDWEKIGSTDTDLADYVKNTDYATGNKGGVIRVVSAYGYNVSNVNGGIYPNLRTKEQYDSDNDYTFIGKGTLENVIAGKELVNQETLEESQASQDEIIAKLKADHPDIEEEGTDLSINGTGDFELALSPKGNIKQETGTSPNLLNFPNSTNTQGDVTRVIENGIITLNGTPTSVSYNEKILTYTVTETGTYTLLPFKSSTNANIRLLYKINNGSFVSDDANPQISLTSGDSLDIHLRIDSTNRIDNFVLKPMLYKGTDTKPYEPYGASPSPSYPSPVKVVDGEYEVEVENKNLLSYPYYETNKTENGITFTDNGDGTITLNGTATDSVTFRFRWIDEIIKSGTYTFSSFNDLPTGITIYVWDNWGQIGGKWVALYKGSKSMTATSEVDINLRSSLSIASGTILNNVVIKFQIEKGTTATPYVAHKSQTQTIDTSPNPLYSEDDYYYKENGDWYVHNEFIEDTLSATVGYVFPDGSFYAVNSSGVIRNAYVKDNDTKALIWCNYLQANIFNNINSSSLHQMGIGVSSSNQIKLKFDNEDSEQTYWNTTTVNAFLTNNTVKVVYKLVTPTNTKITNTTLINSLEALLTLTAYQDQTNISQTHNESQADMIINAQTIMSMRYMQKEIENLSSRLALLE